MKRNNLCYIGLLLLFAAFIVAQNTAKIYAQSNEIIDSKTGETVEKERLPRFISLGHFDGFINNTKIRFFSDVYITNDENKLSKTAFSGEDREEVKNLFEKAISDGQKIIERGKIIKDNKKTFERIVTMSEKENGKSYNILLYDGGKSFISISAGNLEIALNFEKRLAFKK